METDRIVVPAVEFVLTDAEATSPFTESVKQRRLLQGLFGATIAISLLNAVMALGFVRPGHSDPVLASLALSTVAVTTVGISAIRRRARPRKQRRWSVSFDDAGMQLAAGAGPARTIPWHAIRSVNDAGAVFILRYGKWPQFVIIPRRAYADRGTELWACLQRRLIGQRSLQRRPDTRLIVNTASR